MARPTTRTQLKLMPLELRDVPARAGALDLSFGTGGQVQVPLNLGGSNLDQALAVATQADGSTLLAGSAAIQGGSSFAVVRLTPEGVLDSTFGTNGKVTINFSTANTTASAVASELVVQPNGRILVGGTTTANGDDFAVVRLRSNGTLDSSFGTSGKLVFGFDLAGRNEDTLGGIALQSDGKIILAGTVESTNGTDVGLVRLTSMGVVDTSYGTDGKTITAFDLGGTNNDTATAVALASDGRLVVVGSADTNVGSDFAVSRYTTTGELDMTFDADGKRAFAFDIGGSNNDFAQAVVIKSNRRFIVAGQAVGLGRSEFAAVGFNVSGSIDSTFGTSGRRTVNLNGGGANQATANAILMQPAVANVPGSERFVLAGTVNPGTNANFALVGLTLNGAVDTTFGVNGITQVPFDNGGRNNDFAYGATLNPSGRIIVAGSAETVGTNNLGDMAVVRLIGNPPSPQPLLAGGIANGTARILNLNGSTVGGVDFSYAAGDTLNFFPDFTGTVRTATGDLNGDGVNDYIGGAGPGGGPRLVVFDGKTRTRMVDFFTFESVFTGGVYVSSADMTGDGKADVIVTPDEGGGPVTAIYDGAKLAAGLFGEAAQVIRFFGIDDPTFRGGARSTAGDVTGDGIPEVIVAAGFGGGPRITIWDGRSVRAGSPVTLKNFFAFEPELRNGAFVSAGDVNGDGVAELAFGGGPGGGPRVRLYDGKSLNAAAFDNLDQIPGTQIANFFAGSVDSRGGVRPVLADRNGDGLAELTVGSGIGDAPIVSTYAATDLLSLPQPTPRAQLDPFFVSVPQGVFVG